MKTPVRLMGILNATPDSFVSFSRTNEHMILTRVETMLADGMDILDLGGESSGPGSTDVSSTEEWRRIEPILMSVRHHFPALPISLDTVKADVAKRALDMGVAIINDISAGRYDEKMFSICREYNATMVLMYSKDSSPRTTIAAKKYDDVLQTIRSFLLSRIEMACSNGIARERITLDPGLGHFISSIPEYSWEILERLNQLSDLGPILVSPARKSFLAGPHHLPISERLPATLEATKIAIHNGASIIRTHDVKETKEVIMNIKFIH